MPKKRVNITIDDAVHDEMKKFLDVVDNDFSAFVESMCISFLSHMRPLIRRISSASGNESELTPSEVRVMFLQLMGSIQIDAGTQLGAIMKELDILEAEQKAKFVPVAPQPEPIHNPKKKRTVKTKK